MEQAVTQVFFALLATLAFAGFGRALWRVVFDDGLELTTQGDIYAHLYGDCAPPAEIDEPLCSKVLDCGHACNCALGHAQKCACWRPNANRVGITHCGVDASSRRPLR